MFLQLGAFLFLLLISSGQQQSIPPSPCPNVFTYEAPGSEQGRWYGTVNLSTDSILHSLWLNIVLDSKADILGNWIGDVTTTDNIDFKIENTQMKLHPGPATAVRFFVQYNLLNKVPRLQAIRLNGREICNANNPISLPEVERPTSDSRTTTSRPVRNRPEENSFNAGRPGSEIKPEDRPVTRPVQGQTYRPAGDGPIYVPTQNPPIDQTNARPFSISDSAPSQSVGSQTSSRPKPTSSNNGYRGTTDKPRPSSNPSRGEEEYFANDSSSSSSSQSVGTQTGSGRKPSAGGQRVTTVKPRPSTKPSRGGDDEDFVDDSKPVDESEYFGGGLVTIVTGGSSTNPNEYYDGDNRAKQGVCGKVVGVNPLVVNGRQTYEGQWPWQIALYQTQTVDNKYICGGTLVSHKHIITAAHCVTRKGSSKIVNKNTLTVYLGKHNLRTSTHGVQIRFVADIRVYPSYNASSFSNDLSILELQEPVQYTDRVRPACLWPENQVDLSNVIGKKGSVVGWGFDDKGVATEELTLIEMPVVDQETCIRSYSEFFARFTSEYTFCAGYRNGTSVCNGDSGGGMVFNMQDTWYLRGLVSLSVARQNEYRCDPTHYVVFTDLAKFLSWIKRIVNNY